MAALDEKHILPYFIVIVLSFMMSSAYCCSTSGPSSNNDHLPDNGYFQEESSYDCMQAFPSYIDHGRSTEVEVVNVLNFGAKGDGRIDDTKAFEGAWNQACSSLAPKVCFVAPQNKNYLLKPINFSGPCKPAISMKIAGNITASRNIADYSKDQTQWLYFNTVWNLSVAGGGIINGNGDIWWENSCKISRTELSKSKQCSHAPMALTFSNSRNLVVSNLKTQNPPGFHTTFENCRNVNVSYLTATAPENSPNTDGIHVTNTQNIQILNCTISTGDDCISIVNGSYQVRAMGITCGPGHGISIGSLGARNSEAHVSHVVVNGATLKGTTNGVRIKTWQGGSGNASDIEFQNVQMQNVKNPIIIDQNYCDEAEPCVQKSSAVQVTNVVYGNIHGTSATDVAITFNCSKSHPCSGIRLQNVNLEKEDGGLPQAVCNHVLLSGSSTWSPRCP